ncbi:uncharacterized protein OCT59_024005 [Rhizophagus irregularis]|uniref:uncharacterized protein n=1 Tax=Rhizophagus irregularis TaxID=588596 RepID=UPI001A0C3BDF|nr:hypothetical protein OCT59_024005 [Rhizophagus irregularis]GBC22127.2 hypothetical protein GLOIN_2v1881269 [Rhizophagus irregularis DAOM 181602=DAOM 197198]
MSFHTNFVKKKLKFDACQDAKGNIYYQALNQSLKAGEQFTIAANDIMTPTLLGPYSIEVAVVDQPSDPKNSYEVHACAITVVLP